MKKHGVGFKQDVSNGWVYIKEQHKSWDTALDYWTNGSVTELRKYAEVSKEDPYSAEHFARAGLLLFGMSPYGKMSKSASKGAGKASKYKDVTEPTSRFHNRRTGVTREKFEENLIEEGWTRSISKDGKAVNYEKDGARYSIREGAKSTGETSADYYKKGSKKIDVKIRLGK
ncbi:hypothetical protein [Paenibacillus lemnae]|uniref:Uncharacterized protein n=1 Tax=Paenibacillus lemnae TaxID=1330551 RepID=A0A848M214_PAELE|nr:hypothetical protein [Paenibacillus lemnae]NMO94917.1 hypothetical protein [Paenibacillus lemnae]